MRAQNGRRKIAIEAQLRKRTACRFMLHTHEYLEASSPLSLYEHL